MTSWMRPFVITSTLAVLLSSCSLSEGEPKITFCKAIVSELLHQAPIVWHKGRMEIEEEVNVQVILQYELVKDSGQEKKDSDVLGAVCVYPYSNIAEFEPFTHEYEDAPSDVILNGKMVDRLTLMEVSNTVMLNAAKEMIK